MHEQLPTSSSDHLSESLDDTDLADSLALGTTDDPQAQARVDVGEQLLAHRTTAGMTLEAAASAASIDPEHLAGAEDGIESLDEPEIARLAGVYGVDTTAFFGGRVTPFSYLAGA